MAIHVPQFLSPQQGQPLWLRAINRVGRLAARRFEPDAAAWWRAAINAESESAAEESPTPEAREALAALVEALRKDAALSFTGRLSARDDTVRVARTHLRVERALREAPEISQTELPPPIFIIGWPRTGSTALHTLLAEDTRNRTLPYWESFDPVPPASGPDLRAERLDAMLSQLERVAPGYQAIHPMAADMTEECVALFMNHFRSLQLDIQYRVPHYVSWLLAQDARIAYEAYRRQLQLVQHFRPAGDRFVLKDPTHIVHFDTLLRVFPEAKIIFTHRDPVESISSICSLYAYTRAIFSDEVDPLSIGPEILEGYWPTALDRALAMRDEIPAERRVDVRHPDLVRDPIGTAERIYDGLGLALDDPGRSAMEARVARIAAAPRDTHEHSLDGFGLSREAVAERFASYRERFSLLGS